MILLQLFVRVAAALITPTCGCGELGEVVITIPQDDGPVTIWAGCAQEWGAQRLYLDGEDPWEVK